MMSWSVGRNREDAVCILAWQLTKVAAMENMPCKAVKYKSSMDALSQIIKNDGAKSLFKGVGANILVLLLTSCSQSSSAMQVMSRMKEYNGAHIEVKAVEDYNFLNSSYVPVLTQLESTSSQRFYFENKLENATIIFSRTFI
ncbi:galacturonosyltransferase 8 [Tanacetum coccineum]